jgi:4a-hydroxytetrahydrobiopterin dehydratase
MMKALTQSELDELLTSLPKWHLAGGKLVRDYTFPDFVQAIAFVNQLAALAEQQNHHPDIDIRYHKVRLGLVTHDANGITQRDATLAAHIDTLSEPNP